MNKVTSGDTLKDFGGEEWEVVRTMDFPSGEWAMVKLRNVKGAREVALPLRGMKKVDDEA